MSQHYCGVCARTVPEHDEEIDHKWTFHDPGRYRGLLGLLRLAGIDAYQWQEAPDRWMVRVDYPTTEFFALVTRSQVGPMLGYDLGLYSEIGEGVPLEFHDGISLNRAIERIKGGF